MSENNKEIERLLGNSSFMRWLEGKSSKAEMDEWNKWEAADPGNKELAANLRMIHNNLGFLPSEGLDVEGELEKLNVSIDSYPKLAKLHYLHSKRSTIQSFLPKIAAVFLMAVLTFTLYSVFNQKEGQEDNTELVVQEYLITTTESGQKKILTLADGSTITLNGNSKLRYPMQRTSDDVELWLEGEAYFQIAHLEGEESRELKIHVKHGEITVLGTTFNVNAYTDQSTVYLEEGSVNLDLKENEQIRDSYLMYPGEVSILSPDNTTIKTSKANPDQFTSWIEDRLVFDRTSLSDVFERISHIYNVEFDFEKKQYQNLLISGSLPNNNLSVFIKALEDILDQEVSYSENTIYVGNR